MEARRLPLNPVEFLPLLFFYHRVGPFYEQVRDFPHFNPGDSLLL
jgi:hypothetical protein